MMMMTNNSANVSASSSNNGTSNGSTRQARKHFFITSKYNLLLGFLSALIFLVSLFSLLHLHRSIGDIHPVQHHDERLNLYLLSKQHPSNAQQQHQQGQQRRPGHFLQALRGSASLTSSSFTEQQEPPAINNIDENNVIHSVTWPDEEPIANPPLADGYNTFSSCLLVMDDNHRLVEWLAYHYHVLPLRYVVVAVDPRSNTSPTSIFNQWRRRGMVIEEWGDRDFWRQDLKLAPIPDGADLQFKRDRHRGRQKYFYRKCLIHMKQKNRTWVALHDSDEYLLYNHAGGEKFHEYMRNLKQRVENRMSIEEATNNRNPDVSLKVLLPSKPPPTTAEEGALIRYIRQEQAANIPYYQSPCIGVPRLMFGAEETSSRAQQQRRVPDNIHPDLIHQLDTLRYRKHARRNDFVKNALGKVLMDVSRIDVAKSPNFMSLHRPIKSICSAPWHNDWDSGLRINHYLGSWESYSFRDDSRKGYERSKEQWEYKASTNGELSDDHIRPWLDGFVKSHGEDEATEWLQGAGLPKNYRNKNDEQWHLLPEKLEKILSTNVTVANDNKMVAFDAWVREKYKNQPLPPAGTRIAP